MVVTAVQRHIIYVRILGGEFHGTVHPMPKIQITSNDGELPYIIKRFQFPIRLCFAMTINKSQGQSLNHVGVDLRLPVFSHGQLYVALSRVTDVNNLCVLLPPGRTDRRTANIIYNEVLLPCKYS